jgi:hypothetical protein
VQRISRPVHELRMALYRRGWIWLWCFCHTRGLFQFLPINLTMPSAQGSSRGSFNLEPASGKKKTPGVNRAAVIQRYGVWSRRASVTGARRARTERHGQAKLEESPRTGSPNHSTEGQFIERSILGHDRDRCLAPPVEPVVDSGLHQMDVLLDGGVEIQVQTVGALGERCAGSSSVSVVTAVIDPALPSVKIWASRYAAASWWVENAARPPLSSTIERST